MANFTFFQDLLREKRGGKYSSKKIWGAVTMSLLCLAFVGDGFDFYEVKIPLFNTFALIGTTLIGLGTAASILKRNKATEDEEPK